ncbi:F0F1 ATP synthase subunit epsilon [Roseicyclus persicicus]|uniref:ATP synthase epsilon chain n=1 Tax=Roseicyclus persicicus TaxID=2650661 RepID=A0A7X6GZS0_9RHOB|nr:F0F1 ATP synthase subunit epsilon [Roseibacterium persicicum]NKX44246.1 F0F1 ATP synthase subunit epsilon [Roseibacterium persicicum]
MAKLQFDLVSPERRLASMAVDAVQIPGADGDMTAMADHAPLITTLRPGVLKVEGADGGAETAYFVTGGFADVAGPSVTVLAERALPVSEVTAEMMDGFIAEAREAHDKARAADQPQGVADSAAKLLADMEAAKGHIMG